MRLRSHFLLLLFLIASFNTGAAAAALAGRPVSSVLKELQGAAAQFLFSSSLLPDTITVLTEPVSTDPVEKAREILRPHGLGLRTVKPGLYAVVVDRSAASTHSERVPDDDTQLRLPPADSVPLPDITVTTSRYATEAPATTSTFLLEGADLASHPTLGDDSVRALARLPGIAQNGISAQSNVRGGAEDEVLILLDGFPLRQAFHLPAYQSLFSILDPGIIGTAEVFTGGFPARYGNRMSGVFDLKTLDAKQLPRHALGLSFFNASAIQSGQIPSADIHYLAAGRVGTLKPLLHAFSPGAGDPSYSDVFARFDTGDPSTLRVTGNVLWARDELSISSQARGERAEIESRSRYLWLRGDRKWSGTLSGSLWIGHSRIDSVRRGTLNNPGIALGAVADSRASQFWDWRGQLFWQSQPNHYFETGFEGTTERAKYFYEAGASYAPSVAQLFDREARFSRSIDTDPSRNRLAWFGTHRWRASDTVTTEWGVRLQHLSSEQTGAGWTADPRLSVRWQLFPRTSLRAHWGRFHQADEVQELAVEDGFSAFAEPQRSDHLIFGVDHQLSNGVAVRVEGFRKNQSAPRVRNENILSTLSILPEIAPDRTTITPQYGEIKGVEVSLAHEDPRWRRWASIVWSDAKDEIDDEDVPRSWDQTWALSSGLELRGSAWRLGAAASVHRGWPATRLLETPNGATQLGARNGARLPYYAALDLRAEAWHSAWEGTMSYAIEISNALDRRNVCCSELSSAPGALDADRIVSRERAWLPLIPSLSVRWER